MDACRWIGALFVVGALLSTGCESDTGEPGSSPVCVDVAGVWDVTMVGETGTGIMCPDRSLVWTVRQHGCDVTIESEAWDPANGASGGVVDNRLYVEWSRREDCYRYDESIDVTVDGDTMTGKYYLHRGQAVYPAYCPGVGICSAAINGGRRISLDRQR
jgi:hypothetical protein